MISLDEIRNVLTCERLTDTCWNIEFKGNGLKEERRTLALMIDSYNLDETHLEVFLYVFDKENIRDILKSAFLTESIMISHKNQNEEDGFDIIVTVRHPKIVLQGKCDRVNDLRMKISYEIIGERIE